MMTKLFYFLALCCSLSEAYITSTMVSESYSYLDNINKAYINKQKPLTGGIRKLMPSIIKDNKPEKKLEKGYTSSYSPIPIASFDTIFMNIRQITKIYMPSNVDRMIFEIDAKNRFVYYITNKVEHTKIDQLIQLMPNKCKMIIINDVQNVMDDPFGYLYCDK